MPKNPTAESLIGLKYTDVLHRVIIIASEDPIKGPGYYLVERDDGARWSVKAELLKRLFPPGRKIFPSEPKHPLVYCMAQRVIMPRLKLYTLTLTALFREKGTPGTVRAVPGACAARNLGHAIDQGMDAARRLYPSQEGWSDHKAIAIEIPSHLIEEVYTQEVEYVSG